MAASTGPAAPKPGRNEPCHCGSGKKYKHCCLDKDHAKEVAARAKAAKKAAAADAEAAPAEGTAKTAPARTPKPQTHQPWKAATSRGFIPRTRTPRKVGGS